GRRQVGVFRRWCRRKQPRGTGLRGRGLPRLHLMKRYFVTGLLIWIPLGITVLVLNWLISTLDQSLDLLPAQLRPEALWGMHIPGFGAVLTVLVVLLTGVFAANFIGQRLVRFWEGVLA